MFLCSQSGMLITKVPTIINFEIRKKDLRNQKCLDGSIIFLETKTHIITLKLTFNYQLLDTKQYICINLWVNDTSFNETVIELPESYTWSISEKIVSFFDTLDMKENDLLKIKIHTDSTSPILLSTKPLHNTLTIL
jgi:hypothetical protein